MASRRLRRTRGEVERRLGHRLKSARRRWLILAAVCLALAAMVLVAGAVWASYSEDLPSVDSFGTNTLSQVTKIYASDGTTLLEQRYRPSGGNRTVVSLDDVSRQLQSATIAVEDKDFYSHGGVDLPRVISAAIFDLTHRQAAQGASTITEQVVKNSLLSPDLAKERSLDRKIKELILATEIEGRYDKRRILEMYLNSIYYGNGAYGVEAAAEFYFGVHAKELRLAEAAMIAGLPQSPSRYDPLTDAGYAATRAREHDVLRAMQGAGFITAKESDEAFARDLKAEISAARTKADAPRVSLAPHFVDYILQELRSKYGPDFVDRGGLRVITTLSPQAQDLASRVTKEDVAAVAKITRPGRDPDDGRPNYGPNTGAMLVVSPRTGAILAMVGSVDYNNADINGSVNNTVFIPPGPDSDSLGDTHQVGSSFKPYTYVTALANGLTASSILIDAGANFPGYPAGQQPRDFDGRQLGAITLAYSLQHSRNISSMHLFQALGADRVFATAEALGIHPEYLKNKGVAATLGANEMPMLDHVAAYGAFANGGLRLHPWAIARITDAAGHVIENHHTPTMEPALPPDVALKLTDILKGAEKPAGYNLNIPLAVKSGTSEHWTDSWYMGYTSDLVMGVWMAHLDKNGRRAHMNVIYGENGAGLMLRDFLKGWYQGTSPADFRAKPSLPCYVPAPRTPSPKPSQSGSPRPSASPSPHTVPSVPYQYPTADPSKPAPSPTPCPSPTVRPPSQGGSPSPGPGAPPTPGSGGPPEGTPNPRPSCRFPPFVC